jgi:hypothetical protein
MGAREPDLHLVETALMASAPALASCLVAMTQFAESPMPANVQRIVCHLDCASEDESCDAATRAICALLARCWLYGLDNLDAIAGERRGFFRAQHP